MKLTPELLEQFAKVLEENNLAEFSYEEGDCSLHLIRKHSVDSPIVHAVPQAAPVIAEQPAQVSSSNLKSSTISEDTNCEIIRSPIVGTAYLSPEPGAPTFVKVGDTVQQGEIIMIIEAMKVMNQLKAPVSGIIKEVMVSDAKPVEFDEILVKIQKT